MKQQAAPRWVQGLRGAMRPICPYCQRRCPQLVPLVCDTAGQVLDVCCRACESAMQAERILWPRGSGLARTP